MADVGFASWKVLAIYGCTAANISCIDTERLRGVIVVENIDNQLAKEMAQLCMVRDMNQQRYGSSQRLTCWQLIARRLANEASERDLEELAELLKDDPEMRSLLGILLAIWEREKPGEAAMDKEASMLILKIKQRCIMLDSWWGGKREERKKRSWLILDFSPEKAGWFFGFGYRFFVWYWIDW